MIEAWILGRIAYLIPGVIWLLAFALFQHEKKVPGYVWVLIATYFILNAVGSAYFRMYPERHSLGLLHTLLYIVPQIINIAIYIHTLCLAVLEYRQDLIEERRRLRVAFVAVLGTFWLVVALDVSINVLVNAGLNVARISTVIEMTRDILMFPTLLAVNLILFRITKFGFSMVSERLLGSSGPKTSTDILDPKDIVIRDKLLHAMDVDKVYSQSGLTIGNLAKHLNVQEYKLRSVINKMLKFNNFSQFLNKYRIQAAEQRLLTTNDPIFNIGLDVGYTSLSSFHKAFKECHGITPKEYRIMNRRMDSGNDGSSKSILYSL